MGKNRRAKRILGKKGENCTNSTTTKSSEESESNNESGSEMRAKENSEETRTLRQVQQRIKGSLVASPFERRS